MRVHLQALADDPVAQDLDARILADETFRRERFRRDLAVRGVVAELRHVHRDERPAEAVLEAAELRHAHVQRGLATLEPSGKPGPGPRELPLRPSTRGFPLPLRRAATNPAPQLAGAALRAHFVLAHQRDSFASVTTTRCATRRSIPRTVALSSCETTWPVPRSPRPRGAEWCGRREGPR